jgi:hypothetical protein
MTDLHDHLDDLARATDVPAGDLDAVVRRGRRRANRARAGVGLVAVVAAITTGAVIIGGDDDATPIAAGDATNATTGDTGVTWSVTAPTSALAQLGRATVANGTQLYALSTAPGQAPTEQPMPLRVWSSADGVDWTDAGEPTGDIYLSDLDATDGRLYAVGTGPATAATTVNGAVPEMLIGASDDGGSSWQTSGVDIDLAAIAEHSTSMSWSQRDVATSGDAVVALVGVHAELDVHELLPEGDDAPNGWAITSTGVDVLGPAPEEPCPKGGGARTAPTAVGEEEPPPARVWGYTCDDGSGGYTMTSPQDAHGVERSYTWAELGVGGDLLDATLGNPIAFVRTPDGTFQRVAVPAPAIETGWSTLTGGSAGFDLIVNPADGSTPTRLHSADGVTWTGGAPLPAGLAWVNGTGTLGDRTVLQGNTETNAPLVVIGDQVVDPYAILGDAAAGDELYWAAGAAGDAGVVVIVGSVPKRPGVTEYDSGEVQYVALWSRDGSTWEYRTLDELAGQRIGSVTSAVVTADRFVVTAGTGERDADGHLRQLALVGA